jgi:hypothetical protein
MGQLHFIIASFFFLTVFGGCTSTVKYALKEATLDASEEARGDTSWDYGHFGREKSLAIKYVQELIVNVDSAGLFSIRFRNQSNIRKIRFCLYKRDPVWGELIKFFGTGLMNTGETVERRFPPGKYICRAIYRGNKASPDYCFELGKIPEFDPVNNDYPGELIEYQF